MKQPFVAKDILIPFKDFAKEHGHLYARQLVLVAGCVQELLRDRRDAKSLVGLDE